MKFAIGIIIGCVSAFAAGQGIVPSKSQKFWLIGAWLIGMPMTTALFVSIILE